MEPKKPTNWRRLADRLNSLDDWVIGAPKVRTRGWIPRTRIGLLVRALGAGLSVVLIVNFGLIAGIAAIPLAYLLIIYPIRRWDERREPLPPSPPTPPPSDIVASSVLTTQLALSRAGRRRWLLLSAGVALFACFVVAASISDDHETRLDHGGMVGGTVLTVSSPGTYDNDHVRVAYVVADRHYEETVRLDDDSPTFKVGQHVTVEYSPSNPSDMTLPGVSNESAIAVFGAIVILFASLGSFILVGFGFRRSRIGRRVLGSTSWRLANLELRGGRTLRIDGHDYRVSQFSEWLAGSQPLGPVWVAADANGHLVVARTDGTHPTLGKYLSP